MAVSTSDHTTLMTNKAVSTDRQTIRVKPHSYQPSKAELEEQIHINARPKQLAKAVVTRRWCAETSVRRGPGHRDGRRGMIST